MDTGKGIEFKNFENYNDYKKDKYPELSKYIEEMQETIPDEKDPEVTRRHLQTYYESLHSDA